MLNYRQVRQYQLDKEKKTSPALGAKILVIGFAAIILIGTFFLSLPIATEGPAALTWGEALFTSTSATTVTGLIVVGTEATFSTFGEVVILILIQIGGIGFITLSVILFRLIGRRVSIYERILLSQTLGVGERQGVVQLTLTVITIVFGIELVGAVFLFIRWVQIMEWPQAAYFAIFHSISAFCNAGFDLFTGLDDPLVVAVQKDPVVITTLSLLIIAGTLGITVVYDLLVWPRTRHLSLHTRLVIPLILGLMVSGTLLVMLDETFVRGHALSMMPVGQRWLMAIFTIVSSRTAGITLIPMAELGEASQLMILVSMFIGGAPASMAGGVGVTTVAVVLVTLRSIVRGHNDIRVLQRTLPTETIYKAVAILTISTGLVVGTTMVMMLIDQGTLFPVAFEVVSAFSNTGYSLGITSDFGTMGRLLLVFIMFWGRLGPLTLVVALAQRHRHSLIHYPEEKIIIG